LRQRVLLELQEFLDRISNDALREMDLWELNTEGVARLLSEAAEEVALSSEVPECETAIFEGAQGVLLDEYRGFHPHTTWSTVTTHHAWELVRQMEVEAVAVLGVTRAYSTRHGEGPFPTGSPELTERLRDPGNPWNRWQGSIRCGWLDLPLLRYAVEVAGPLDGIVVNHLDQVPETGAWVCDEYKGVPLAPSEAPNLAWQSRLTQQLRQAEPMLAPTTPEDLIERVSALAPVVLTGSGPTHRERHGGPVNWRARQAASLAASMA
jgi:adenylosuccinate synthase